MAKATSKAGAKAAKKRKVIVDSVGEAHVTASFNNIIISLTNKKGDVISWSSAVPEETFLILLRILCFLSLFDNAMIYY